MKESAVISKRGAYLHISKSGKRASVIPNKKKKAARNFCRGHKKGAP